MSAIITSGLHSGMIAVSSGGPMVTYRPPVSWELESLVPYGASYFQSGNYADYAERRDRYLRTAAEIVDELQRLSLLEKKRHRILDYGCGPGYLLDGFTEAGVGCLQIAGVEVSEWAASEAMARGFRVYSGNPTVMAYDIMTALDVFEHMTDAAIVEAIRAVNPRVIVARIPCSTDGGKTFHLAVSRRDASHINCKDKPAWEAFFADLGYLTMRLQLFTVYDTAGVACLLAVRK